MKRAEDSEGGALAHLADRLASLASERLLRERPAPVEDVASTFCSNDYLGLAEGSASGARTGAGASRLIVGERKEHRQLEDALAAWLQTPATLLFSSGYAANVGTLAALGEPGDVVVSDALNHASIIDGCRLSRARLEVVPHLDLDAVARALASATERRRWVVTESYFSMDGDTPDLEGLRRVCDEHGAALIVDEAHALGVFGPAGRGLCAARGVEADVLVGTLGKAFGVAGAFVAGSRSLVAWLWNRARSFVFSTGVSPLVASAALDALPILMRDEERRERLHRNVSQLRLGLRALGLSPLGHGPIVPVVLGDSERALDVAAALRAAGVHVQAVRPPTVPRGTARLRLTVTASHQPSEIDGALRAIEKTLPWVSSSSSSEPERR